MQPFTLPQSSIDTPILDVYYISLIMLILVTSLVRYKGLKYSYKKSKPGYFKRFFRRSGKSKVDKLDQRIPLLATSDSDDY